jgi:hypothetical protein
MRVDEEEEAEPDIQPPRKSKPVHAAVTQRKTPQLLQQTTLAGQNLTLGTRRKDAAPGKSKGITLPSIHFSNEDAPIDTYAYDIDDSSERDPFTLAGDFYQSEDSTSDAEWYPQNEEQLSDEEQPLQPAEQARLPRQPTAKNNKAVIRGGVAVDLTIKSLRTTRNLLYLMVLAKYKKIPMPSVFNKQASFTPEDLALQIIRIYEIEIPMMLQDARDKATLARNVVFLKVCLEALLTVVYKYDYTAEDFREMRKSETGGIEQNLFQGLEIVSFETSALLQHPKYRGPQTGDWSKGIPQEHLKRYTQRNFEVPKNIYRDGPHQSRNQNPRSGKQRYRKGYHDTKQHLNYKGAQKD